jgi:uncharacterized membrane protein
MAQRQLIPARRMAWLQRELAAWRADGLVDDAATSAIAERYEASSRARAARVLVTLGAALVGVGIIWLVASNLDIDEAGPLTRFFFVCVLWLVFVALAEAVRGRERFGVLAAPLALLAAIAYGATIFQVAQSLQVPAYEPWLLAAWAAGALAYAYATGGSGPLVLGVGTAVGCYVWLLTRDASGGTAFVLGLALAVPFAVAAAVLHRERERFAAAWRFAAALVALPAIGGAAIPGVLDGSPVPALAFVVGGVAIAVAVVVALLRADDVGFIELAVATGIAGAAIVLALTATELEGDVFSGEELPAGPLAHALVASALFLALSVAIAFDGVARESAGLTNLAIAAIVLFVAIQSFGLIAPLFSGAALVLAVGAILVVCGLLADRGRRRLLREMAS